MPFQPNAEQLNRSILKSHLLQRQILEGYQLNFNSSFKFITQVSTTKGITLKRSHELKQIATAVIIALDNNEVRGCIQLMSPPN